MSKISINKTPQINVDTKDFASVDKDNFQEKKTNPVIKALGEMLKVKSIRNVAIAIFFVILLLITTTILRSTRRDSVDVSQKSGSAQKSNTDYNPESEIDLPQQDGQNESASSQEKINKEQSPPESVVTKFLEYNKDNNRNSAISLLSSRVKEFKGKRGCI
jgi:hypothetical protein